MEGLRQNNHTGLGSALYDAKLSASILDIYPQEHTSRILRIMSMVGSFGSIAGPALFTLLNSSMDARSIFLIDVGVVFLTALIGLIHQGNDRSSEKEPDPKNGSGKKVLCQFLKVGSTIRT